MLYCPPPNSYEHTCVGIKTYPNKGNCSYTFMNTAAYFYALRFKAHYDDSMTAKSTTLKIIFLEC